MKILATLILLIIGIAYSSANIKASAFVETLTYKNDKSIISVPVRVHLLKSNTENDITAVISSEELEEIFDVVNVIWKQAGIKYEVESVSFLSAFNEELYIEALSRNSKQTRVQKNRAMNQACNITKKSTHILNLCITGKTVNNLGGIYFGRSSPKVVWPTISKKGKKLINPATLAHEFGHYLRLKHNSENDIYLMKGGGNNIRRDGQYENILLTEREISASRKTAIKLFK